MFAWKRKSEQGHAGASDARLTIPHFGSIRVRLTCLNSVRSGPLRLNLIQCHQAAGNMAVNIIIMSSNQDIINSIIICPQKWS